MKVIVINKKGNKYEEPYKVVYLITKVCRNVSVTICWVTIKELINSRWIKTYQI